MSENIAEYSRKIVRLVDNIPDENKVTIVNSILQKGDIVNDLVNLSTHKGIKPRINNLSRNLHNSSSTEFFRRSSNKQMDDVHEYGERVLRKYINQKDTYLSNINSVTVTRIMLNESSRADIYLNDYARRVFGRRAIYNSSKKTLDIFDSNGDLAYYYPIRASSRGKGKANLLYFYIYFRGKYELQVHQLTSEMYNRLTSNSSDVYANPYKIITCANVDFKYYSSVFNVDVIDALEFNPNYSVFREDAKSLEYITTREDKDLVPCFTIRERGSNRYTKNKNSDHYRILKREFLKNLRIDYDEINNSLDEQKYQEGSYTSGINTASFIFGEVLDGELDDLNIKNQILFTLFKLAMCSGNRDSVNISKTLYDYYFMLDSIDGSPSQMRDGVNFTLPFSPIMHLLDFGNENYVATTYTSFKFNHSLRESSINSRYGITFSKIGDIKFIKKKATLIGTMLYAYNRCCVIEFTDFWAGNKFGDDYSDKLGYSEYVDKDGLMFIPIILGNSIVDDYEANYKTKSCYNTESYGKLGFFVKNYKSLFSRPNCYNMLNMYVTAKYSRDLEWYETKFFKYFTIGIGLTLTAYTLGASSAITASLAAASVGASVVGKFIGSNITEAIIELSNSDLFFNSENVNKIVAIALMATGFGALSLINFTTTAMLGIGAVTSSLQAYISNLHKMNSEKIEEELKEIIDINKELETLKESSDYNFATKDNFDLNIGNVYGHEYINNFTDLTLSLPL